MTAFIIIVVISLFMVAVGFTWYRLEAYDGMEKVIICVAGILLSWAITNILFSLSANGMEYLNIELKNEISKILVLIFTPINGIVFMPYIAKIMSELKFGEIENQEALKKIIKMSIIVLIIFFIEVKYLASIQTGILEIATKI